MKQVVKGLVVVLICTIVTACMPALNISAEEADFTMTDSTMNVLASDILSKGTFESDPEKFDRAVYPGPETDPTGQIFWHSGNGDTFTFDVDFGNYVVPKMTYNHGGPSMTLNVYADGVLVGSGVAPEASRDVAANMCEISLNTALTGVKTIKLEIVSDTVVWPGTDFGKIMFYNEIQPSETTPPAETIPPEKTTPPAETPKQDNSETGDASVFAYTVVAITALSAVIVMAILKKERGKIK